MLRRRPFRLAWAALATLLLATLLNAVPGNVTPAGAATGDVVHQTTFSVPCPNTPYAPGGAGMGIAFDGVSLWYTCLAPPSPQPDLYRADPRTGRVTGAYLIAGGLGAIAYDAVHNGLWAGWDYISTPGTVRFIPLAPTVPLLPRPTLQDPVLTAVSVKFTATVHDSVKGRIDDGIAYDATDDSIYVSEDQTTVIDRYQYGSFANVGSLAYLDGPCGSSGIAVGADVFYEGSDGCNRVFTRNRIGNTPATPPSFSTLVPGDPTHRDEGLACDPITFYPKDVLWSVEAFEPRRAVAFEIPAGSCGLGGENVRPSTGTPPGSIADAYALNATIGGAPALLEVRTLADARTTSGTATNTVQQLVLPNGLGEVVAGGTDVATVPSPFDGTASASADLASFTLTLPTTPPVTISGSAISARARITSSGGAAGPFSASPAGGSIGTLLVDGIPVTVGQPGAPVVIPLPGGIGTITLYDTVVAGDGTTSLEIEVDAIHVVAALPGGTLDVVVGSAYAGVTNGGPLTPRRPNTPLLYEAL